PDLVDRRSFDQLFTGTPPPPLSPAEALASFKVRDGFQIELVAAEPLVVDPVALEWDETGRLWVAEMRDYPLGIDGKGQPGGVIKVLTDDDGNGTLDRATEFLRDVPFPNGVHPWRGGVLVSSAPEIFHAVDTDGDGVADRRTTLFRGFKEGNQQHRVNGFNLGLDGWFYGANGDSGGDIQSLATGKSVSISGRDFRFRPDTGEFEAIEGQTQFGRVRDDWGHWFGNANYTWLWWYPWPMRYLQRNPHFAIRDYRQMLAAEPGRDAVYAISRALPRPNVVGAEGTVTSACSPCPYRDDLFGPEFASSVFIAEPTENLVHREVLERSGSGFTARRADGEETTEFLASTDNWFRPVYLRTGPDGALYVADMYRLVIEHPEWIPEDLKRRWDLRAGTDRGRIYRIAPTRGMVRRDLPFQSTDAATLAQAMDDPNGWRRDTAMRLLLERPDPAAIPALRNVLRTSSRPKARLQALGTLGALGRIETADLLRSLNDPHPSIRASGLQWAESHLSSPQPPSELKSRALSLVSDPAPEVRLQAAFSLGEWSDPHAVRALLSLAESSPSDDLLLVAIASGAHGKLDHWMAALDDCPKLPWPLLRRLIGQVAAAGTEPTVSKAAQLLLKPASAGSETSRFIASAEFLESLSRRRPSRSNEIFTTLAPLLRESA
ncbi:MAG: HEAT repeat domain-containing protein, partial [Nitrospira sp.]|nr:HEAT repeat domain-containing protein [Nitrospira sp.]